MKKIIALLFLTIITLPMMAFDEEDYKQFAREVKKEVWNKDLPQFNNRTVPAKYNKESAVVLARYEEVGVDYTNHFNPLSLGKVKQCTGTHLVRSLVKINDKAALDKFSTFEFRTYDYSLNNGLWRNDRRTVLGVRVIKPNGTIKEVEEKDYQDDNEGRKGEEKHAKLAVPNLQVGDMLDYFYYDFDKLREENIDPMAFFFGSQYPILDYQIHCSIDKDLCTQYRTMNGAPDFKQSTDKDAIILDARVKDIDKTMPDYAYNPLAQTPYTMLFINANVALEYIPKSMKTKGLQANPDAKAIQEDAWTLWNASTSKWSFYKAFNKVIDDAKKISDPTERANYVYNYIMLRTLVHGRPYFNYNNFASAFSYILDKLKVPYSRVLVTDRMTEPIGQLANIWNATYGIMLDNGQCYFPVSTRYGTTANTIPSIYQNRDAVATNAKKKFQNGPFRNVTVAGSQAKDNTEKVDIDATIDGILLNIKRQDATTGCDKEGNIMDYTSAEQMAQSWGADYGVTKFAQLFDKGLNVADQRASERAEQDKKSIAENFSDEIKAYHDHAAVKVNETKVLSCGEKDKPFTYLIDYQMDGLVKKAGRNLVISVGQLVGQQVHIEGAERQRNVDIIYSYPRTYSVTVRLAIPNGYSVAPESLQKLNSNVDNSAISFTSKASVEDGKLLITFEKVYKQYRVPASQWSSILSVLDKAYDFNSVQVVLKKG